MKVVKVPDHRHDASQKCTSGIENVGALQDYVIDYQDYEGYA